MLVLLLWNPWISTVSCPQPYSQNLCRRQTVIAVWIKVQQVCCARGGLWIHVHSQQNTQESEVKLRAVLTDIDGARLDWMPSRSFQTTLLSAGVYREVWYLTWYFKFSRFCDTWHTEFPSYFVDLPLFFSLYFSFPAQISGTWQLAFWNTFWPGMKFITDIIQ